MPKVSYKGETVSDHWVRSPVLNLKNACLGCHQKHDAKITERELQDRVEQIQDRHWQLRQHAMTALMGLIADLKAAKEAGKSDADLATARYLQRRAQFYLDFVEAENSTGFHAPAGSSAHPRRVAQLRPPGPACRPRPELQADGAGRPDPAASGPARGDAGRQAVTDGESCPLG